MANFSNLITTTKGHELITKILAGELETEPKTPFTKIVTSSAVYQMANLEALTNISSIKQETLVSGVTKQNKTSVKIEGAMENSQLTTGYRLNTIGVFFRDPTDSKEYLFGAAIHVPTPEEPNADYIFPFNGITTTGLLFDLYASVGNADGTPLVVDPAAVATVKQLNEAASNVKLIGYTKPAEGGEIAASDTINQALGKHSAAITNMANTLMSPTMHRMIFRGDNLGSTVTAAQLARIRDGSFEGLFVGDYWSIGGRSWRISDMDYWYYTGDTALTKNHLVIMPTTPLYNAKMNATNTTEGGYVGSLMYQENLEQAKTIINEAFGDAVLTHREYLVNAVTDGHPSGGAWFDSSVELPNEIMLYGSYIHTPAGDGVMSLTRQTINKTQLAIYAISTRRINFPDYYWTRDVASASNFALMDNRGRASHTSASSGHGVIPVFAIG